MFAYIALPKSYSFASVYLFTIALYKKVLTASCNFADFFLFLDFSFLVRRQAEAGGCKKSFYNRRERLLGKWKKNKQKVENPEAKKNSIPKNLMYMLYKRSKKKEEPQSPTVSSPRKEKEKERKKNTSCQFYNIAWPFLHFCVHHYIV